MNWDKSKLVPVLVEAGQLALQYFKKTKNTIKSDGSLVTEADIAVEKFLREQLQGPGEFWLGEESSNELSEAEFLKISQNTGYIVDPIDGTMNYANGLEMWGISIGYVENGTFKNGAIYLPCFGEIYLTEEDDVVVLTIDNGKVIEKKALEKGLDHGDREDQELVVCITQKIVKNSTIPFKGNVQSVSSAVYVLTKVLRGSYFGYIGRLKIWDIAAVIPMCKILGFDYRFLNDEKLELKIKSNQFYFKENHSKRFSLKEMIIFSQKDQFEKIKSDFNL